MTITVRFKPLELMTIAEEKTYPRVNEYEILDDNTVVLYHVFKTPDDVLKKVLVGHIHSDRWDDIIIVNNTVVKQRSKKNGEQ